MIFRKQYQELFKNVQNVIVKIDSFDLFSNVTLCDLFSWRPHLFYIQWIDKLRRLYDMEILMNFYSISAYMFANIFQILISTLMIPRACLKKFWILVLVNMNWKFHNMIFERCDTLPWPPFSSVTLFHCFGQ